MADESYRRPLGFGHGFGGFGHGFGGFGHGFGGFGHGFGGFGGFAPFPLLIPFYDYDLDDYFDFD